MPEYLRKRRSEYMKLHPLRYWAGKKRKHFTLSSKGRANIIKGLQTRTVSEKIIEHIKNLNKGKFGKNHPKWNGNKKRAFLKAIRECWKYRQWRIAIFTRDSFTCVFCRKTGYVEADHYPKPFMEIIRENSIKTMDQAISCKELWEAEGRTLCKTCHLTTLKQSRERISKKVLPSKEE